MARAPEFQREQVIEAALGVFWRRGYTQTSISDLVKATGLKPGSLYGAFGSKKGIFLEVLDGYHRSFIGHLDGLARHESGALAGLVTLLDELVDDAVTGRDRRGCLAVNTLLEMSQHDDDIAGQVRRHNEGTRVAFAKLVRRAQEQGDVDMTRSADDLAAFIVNSIWGLKVMCKAESDRAVLNAIAAGVIAGVGNAQQKARVRLSPVR
jgi:TetR/AcrR family transcriptional repressor of nem operon